MKTKKITAQIETALQDGGCCGTSALEVRESSETSCCEQPTDGSSCCDKNQTKEINSENTGCC